MTRSSLDRLIPDYIRRFEAYVPSKPDDELKKLYRCNHIHRLNNNENPMGPPPAAGKIIGRFPPPKASIYPSGDVYYLRQKLARHYGLDPDQFLVGNGANEVISFVIKAFCHEGDNIVTADRTFAVYEWVADFSGLEARLVPLEDFGFDDNGILSAMDDRTKIVFICNPNNPTGSYWSEEKLIRFLDRVGDRSIVVVDEAYFEFVEKDDFPDGIRLIRQYPNLVVFRTFSKMYALAGLRIGYLAGDREVVDVIRRTCVAYSVNVLAQEAAVAALGDMDHILKSREMVRDGKTFLTRALHALNLPVINGEGNFIMIRLPISDTLAYRKLMNQGVMVRTMTGFRFPNYIRVTIADRKPLEAFIMALTDIVAQ